jgi:hypothetical protein
MRSAILDSVMPLCYDRQTMRTVPVVSTSRRLVGAATARRRYRQIAGALMCALLCMVAPTPGGAQEFPTPADVERFVREAHAMAVEHGVDQLHPFTVGQINTYASRFGLAALPTPRDLSIARQNRVNAIADSLIAEFGPHEGFRRAGPLERQEYLALSFAVVLRVANTQGLTASLELMREHDYLAAVSSLLMRVMPADPPARLREGLEWAASAPLSATERTRVRAALYERVLPYADTLVMRVARTDEDAAVRSLLTRALLWRGATPSATDSAFDRASWLRHGLESFAQVTDSSLRTQLSMLYGRYCGDGGLTDCDAYGIDTGDRRRIYFGEQFVLAIRRAQLSRADSLRQVLAAQETPEATMMSLVVRGLMDGCLTPTPCATTVRRVRNEWLDRLEAFAVTEHAQADTVRAALAQLFAGEDVERSLRWLSAVNDSALLQRATAEAVRRAFPVDLPGAVALARIGVRAGHGLVLPGGMYARLHVQRQPEVAEQLLREVTSSGARLFQRLEWIRVLFDAGRVEEARERALSALEDWNPDTDPVVGQNMFRVYDELELYPQLIAWAFSRPTGPARAGALLSVLTGLGPVPN